MKDGNYDHRNRKDIFYAIKYELPQLLQVSTLMIKEIWTCGVSITRIMVIPLIIVENLRKFSIDSLAKESWDTS